MKIYLAAPLFNAVELERNRKLRDMLVQEGYSVYLPQEDAGLLYDFANETAEEVRLKLFEADMGAIQECDLMLSVLDGRVPDEGVCIELGAAYSLGKPCIGLLTDKRVLDSFGISLMIEGCLDALVRTEMELLERLKAYRN